MGAEWHRGQLSAWLQKKKSGASVVRVRQYNKRFFTLDFDSQVFFYSHSENTKKVSKVTPFAELLDVRLDVRKSSGALGSDSADGVGSCDLASETSKRSQVSFLRRMSSRGVKEEQEQHVITLLTRPSKQMELVCASPAQATEWLEAFKAAIENQGRGGAACLGIAGATAVISEDGAAVEAGEQDVPAYTSETPSATAAANFAEGIAEAHESPAGDEPMATGTAEAAAEQPEPVPPKQCGTFLDFSTSDAIPEGATVPTTIVTVDDIVETPQATHLDASAFGFGADEGCDSDSSSSSSAGSPAFRGEGLSATGGAPGGAAGLPEGGGGTTSGASPSPVADGHARDSYRDRHEGLSMVQRLQNLEFSDDDGDDDDPLGLGKPAPDAAAQAT